MRNFLGKMLDSWTEALLEWTRKMNKLVIQENTRRYADSDVRKLKRIEVSGDEIAKMRRG